MEMMKHGMAADAMADEFALALLMPEAAFRDRVRSHTDADGMVDVAAVAGWFHVSVTDAHRRGVRLGLLRDF